MYSGHKQQIGFRLFTYLFHQFGLEDVAEGGILEYDYEL